MHNCILQITSKNIFSGISVVYQALWMVTYPVDSVIHLLNNQVYNSHYGWICPYLHECGNNNIVINILSS